MTAYFWPASGQAARGVALVSPFGPGMIVPDEHAMVAWPLYGAAFSFPVSLTPSGNPFLVMPGIAGAGRGSASGVWQVSYQGQLIDLGSSGALTTIPLPVSGFTGLATTSGFTPYALAASGGVYSSGATLRGSFGAPAWDLETDGATTLYALLASGPAVGTMALSGFASGSFAFSSQISVPTCLAASGGPLVAAGWKQGTFVSGFAAMAIDPVNSLLFASCNSSTVSLWTSLSANANLWTFNQAVSGLSPNLGYLAWVPNGTQILAVDPTGGVIEVLNYSAGSLTLSGSVTLSGTAGIAVAADSLHSLVAQPSASGVMPLSGTIGGVWATVPSNFIGSLTGIGPVLTLSSTVAAVGYSAGVAILTLAGGLWSQTTALLSAFEIDFLATDSSTGWTFAAGASGIMFFTPTGIIGSGVQSGPIAGLVAYRGQAFVFDKSGNWFGYGTSNGTALVQFASGSTQLPVVQNAAGVAGVTVFGSSAASGASWLWNFTAPFTLAPVRDGTVAFHSSGAWTYYDLGIDHSPSAVCYDVSGNARVATIQNDLFTVVSGTGVTVSGTVPQYQVSQTVPLGISRLLASGAAIWAATSLPGVLIQV